MKPTTEIFLKKDGINRGVAGKEKRQGFPKLPYTEAAIAGKDQKVTKEDMDREAALAAKAAEAGMKGDISEEEEKLTKAGHVDHRFKGHREGADQEVNPDYTPAETGYVDDDGRHVTADGKPDLRYEENRGLTEVEVLRIQARNLERIAEKAAVHAKKLGLGGMGGREFRFSAFRHFVDSKVYSLRYRMKMKLILVLLMFIVCCGAKEKRYTTNDKMSEIRQIEVRVDKMFTDKDKVSIDKAINQWNTALNGSVVIKVVDNNFNMDLGVMEEVLKNKGLLILKLRSDSTLIIEDKGRTLAFTDKIGGNILYVIEDRVKDDLEGIVMHEMGHIMGVTHKGSGLMQPSYMKEDYRCIDKVTIEEVERVTGVRGMNYCL